MTLTQAAAALTVSAKTLRLAAEVETQHPLADGPWIFKRTALKTETARRLAGASGILPQDMTLSNKPSIYQ